MRAMQGFSCLLITLISVSPISDKEKSYKGKEHNTGNKNDKRNRKKGMVAKPKGHHLNTPSP